MPILEAMAAGLPTICANARTMRDVSAEGALHFRPGNATAPAEQMQKALTAPALIKRGKQRAAAFTWQQTAQSVLRAIAAPLSSRAFFPRFLPAHDGLAPLGTPSRQLVVWSVTTYLADS
jgi:hypothetical protein